MSLPIVLLVEPDAERRQLLAEALEQAFVRVLPVAMTEAASRAATVSPQVVALSLLDGWRDLIPFVRGWRDEKARERIPLLTLIPAGDAAAADEALAAGAWEVLFWPAPDPLVRARIRSIVRYAILQEEIRRFADILAETVRLFEAREPHTIDHSRRVAELSAEMGRAAGFGEEELLRLKEAGRIFDIGLLALPDAVLAKEAPLTAQELAMVRSHPVVGSELLRGIPALEPLRVFVLRHHERVDGSGYPDGLKGREIPLPVQILSLADAYDALTSSRPWRAVRSHAGAMEALAEEQRQGLWDAELLRLLQAATARLGLSGEEKGTGSLR